MRALKKAEHDLHRRPGFLLRQAHQVAVAIFFEEIGDVPLTPPQHNVLATVQAFPDSHQTALARLVAYDRATVGAVLAGLENRELIVRNGAPGDRRLKTIRITRQGSALLKSSAAAMERISQRVVERLSPAEQSQFTDMLARVASASQAAPAAVQVEEPSAATPRATARKSPQRAARPSR